MFHYSSHEVLILQALLDLSNNISLEDIQAECDLPPQEIINSLEKLSSIGLTARHHNQILVDKQLRKYYETQLLRFSPTLYPTIDLFTHQLKKISIELISLWYSLPKNCSNLLQTLIDKFFKSPQLYQRHLSEIQLEQPNLYRAYDLLINSPGHSLLYHEFMQRLELSQEERETYLLMLEFSGIAFLHFRIHPHTTSLTAHVSLLGEWVEYQKIINPTSKEISPQVYLHQDTWWFIKLMEELAITLRQEGLLPAETEAISLQHARAIEKGIEQGLFLKKGSSIYPGLALDNWLGESYEGRAWSLYRLSTTPFPIPIDSGSLRELATQRNIREIERSLRRFIGQG
jgi:hypothetical protein